MRAALLGAQVAVTVVLAAGAGLFARSLIAALSLNPGVDMTRIGTAPVSLGPYGYTPARAEVFFRELRDRLRQNGAIHSAALVQPQGGMTTSGRVTIDGEPREPPSFLAYTAVDEHYFSAMGMPIVEGRDFAAPDTAGSPLVVIVSDSFGRLIAGGASPIGHRIIESSSRPPDPPAVAEVIGVVPDVITVSYTHLTLPTNREV